MKRHLPGRKVFFPVGRKDFSPRQLSSRQVVKNTLFSPPIWVEKKGFSPRRRENNYFTAAWWITLFSPLKLMVKIQYCWRLSDDRNSHSFFPVGRKESKFSRGKKNENFCHFVQRIKMALFLLIKFWYFIFVMKNGDSPRRREKLCDHLGEK